MLMSLIAVAASTSSTLLAAGIVAIAAVTASTVTPILQARGIKTERLREQAEQAALREHERQQDLASQAVIAEKVAEAARHAAQVAEVAEAAAKLLSDRQDSQAARAAEAAQRLAVAQEETKQAAQEVARLAALTAEQTNGQLTSLSEKVDIVHTLVNSQLSGALQNELSGLTREKILLEDALSRPGVDAQTSARFKEAIETADARMVDLNNILADRAAQQEIANQQIKNSK